MSYSHKNPAWDRMHRTGAATFVGPARCATCSTPVRPHQGDPCRCTTRTFFVDDEGPFTLAEMIEANEQAEIREWCEAAKPGDEYRDLCTIRCEAP
jgi:hypothetical protein